MTNQKTTKTLDASKLLGFRSSKPMAGKKPSASTGIQAKVGGKLGAKTKSA